MKVIVAGSRGIKNYSLLEKTIKNSTFKITEIVSGTASGVDMMGEYYSEQNNIPCARYPADWDLYGRKAGIVRNATMATYADCLIALWDGKSRGTAHMIKCMKVRNKPIYVFNIKNNSVEKNF